MRLETTPCRRIEGNSQFRQVGCFDTTAADMMMHCLVVGGHYGWIDCR